MDIIVAIFYTIGVITTNLTVVYAFQKFMETHYPVPEEEPEPKVEPEPEV